MQAGQGESKIRCTEQKRVKEPTERPDVYMDLEKEEQ